MVAMLPIFALAVIFGPTLYDQMSSGYHMSLVKAGHGNDTTHLFTTRGRWEVQYSYDCQGIDSPAMSLEIVDATGKRIPEDVPQARIEQSGKGIIHLITAGTWRVQVTSTCKWTVRVRG